jgi:hypothetical protein
MNVHHFTGTPAKIDQHESKGKPEQKFDALSEQSLKLDSVFRKARRNFVLIFLFNKTNLKTNGLI